MENPEDPTAGVIAVLVDAGQADEATRNAASAQLMAYFKEPGFASVLVVRQFTMLMFSLYPFVAGKARSARAVTTTERFLTIPIPSGPLIQLNATKIGYHCPKGAIGPGNSIESGIKPESNCNTFLRTAL